MQLPRSERWLSDGRLTSVLTHFFVVFLLSFFLQSFELSKYIAVVRSLSTSPHLPHPNFHKSPPLVTTFTKTTLALLAKLPCITRQTRIYTICIHNASDKCERVFFNEFSQFIFDKLQNTIEHFFLQSLIVQGSRNLDQRMNL